MRRTPVILALSLAAVVALAACGSDDNSSSSSTSASTATPASGGKAIVVAASRPQVGRVVVTENGQTVYTLTGADGKAVACQGPCLTAWPPVLVVSGTSDRGGTGVKDVASTAGAGGRQVTLAGLPVYTYSGDGPGQANGDGISNFGGTWHVVKVGGAAASTGSSSTSSTSRSGYGY
jgi:predicted lipoprotein with Yx(FWY)xxD motif